MLRLARIYHQEGNVERVERHVAQGLEALGDEVHPVRLELLKYRGDARIGSGRFETALSDFETIADLEVRADVAAGVHWVTLVTLADLLIRLDRSSEARHQFEEALDAVVDLPWTAAVVRAYADLISLLFGAEELRDAAAWLRKAEGALDHALMAEVSPQLKRLADQAMLLGEPAISCRFLERALQLDEAALGADHHTLVIPMKVLGDLLWELGDTQGAVHHLRRALAIEESCLSHEDPRLVASRAYLRERVERSEARVRCARSPA